MKEFTIQFRMAQNHAANCTISQWWKWIDILYSLVWSAAYCTQCSEHDGDGEENNSWNAFKHLCLHFLPATDYFWYCVCVCVCVHLQSYQIQLVLSKAKGSGWGRVSDGQIAQCKRLADNSLICRFMCHRLDLFTIFPVSIRPLPICLQRRH